MTKYLAEVLVEVELEDDPKDTEDQAFDKAWFEVQAIMQRAWDTDQGRHHVRKWGFAQLEESISVIMPEPAASPASD